MKLTLSFKTRRHNWKWDINRTLVLLSYPLIALSIWFILVQIMCIGSNVAWM